MRATAALRRAPVRRLLALAAILAAAGGGIDAVAARGQGGSSIQATEGQQFTIAVPSCPAAVPQAPTIDWGDGTPRSQATLSNGQYYGTHTYAEEGAYTVTVYCGSTAQGTSAAQVADAALTANGRSIAVTATQPFAGTVATFADSDPGGTAADYTATIDWGDGSPPSPGAVTASGVGFAVGGSHTYASAGAHTATVTIADAGGAGASAADSVTVSPNGPALAVSPSSLSFHVDWSSYSEANANSAPQTVTVTSTGSAPLHISAVNITGTGAGGLVIPCVGGTGKQPCHPADTCTGATLSPGSTCAVSVQYDAADVFPAPSGLLEIDSDAPSSPSLVALSGTSTDLDTLPPPNSPPAPGGCPGTVADGPFGYQTADGVLSLTGCFTDLTDQTAEEYGALPLWSATGDVSVDGVTLVPFSGDDHLFFEPTASGRALTDMIYATGSDTRYLVVVPEPPKLLQLTSCYSCTHVYAARDGARAPRAVRSGVQVGGPECAGCQLALAGYIPPPGFVLGVVDLGRQPFVCAHGNVSPLPAQPCLQASWQFAQDSPPDRVNGLPVLGGEITFAGCGGGNYLASVSANAQLPTLFSAGPDTGGPVTTTLSFLGCPQPPPSDCSEGCLPESSGGGGAGNCIGTQCTAPSHRPQYFQAVDAAAPAPPPPPARAAAAPRLQPRDGPQGQCPSDEQDVLGQLGDAFVGGMGFGQPYLCYAPSTDVWTVGGRFDVLNAQVDSGPPPYYGIGFHSNGHFDHGGIQNVSFGDPGEAIFPPLVYLNSFGGAFRVDPTFLTAHATITVGDVVKIDGGGMAVWATPEHTYTYQPLNGSDPIPGVAQLQADTRSRPITTFAAGAGGVVQLHVPALGDVPLADAYVFYVSPSYFEFGGHLHLQLPQDSDGDADDINDSDSDSDAPNVLFDAGVLGALDTSSGDYDVNGDVNVCANFPWPIDSACLGLNGTVSSRGVGACGDFDGWSPGFRYPWGGNVTLFLNDCDLGPITVSVYSGAAHDAAASGLDLPGGLPSEQIWVDGRGGAPQVRVQGPHGEGLSDPTPGRGAESSQILIVPLARLHQTLIAIRHPAAGHWSITPLAGSPPITEIDHAAGLPPARIAVRVSGRGRTRTLAYRIRPRAGQQVTFAERAGEVFHVLGRARGTRGRLRFAAADGPGGRRQIVALITLSGAPSKPLVVGRYTAPPPIRAGRPRRVRLARRGHTLLVSWGPASGARRYLAAVTLSDGRRLAFLEPASRRRLAVAAVGPELSGRVRVFALSATDVPGPAAAARFSAVGAPGRVRGLTARRTARGVLVRWRRVAGASSYLLLVTLSGRPSQRLVPLLTDRLSALSRRTLPRARPGSVATITVIALSPTGRRGRPATIRYRVRR